MAKETYTAAKKRLLAGLVAKGYRTSDHNLKVPWAEKAGYDYRLWFRPQAIYLNAHSMFLDMRELSVDDLLLHVQRTLDIRRG